MPETTPRPTARTETEPTPTADRSASDAAPATFDPHCTTRLPNAVDGENASPPAAMERVRNGD